MLPVCYQGLELPLPRIEVPSVYLIQLQGDPVFTKVGVSTQPTNRLSSLQVGSPHPFQQVVLYLFRDKAAATDAERAVHGILQDRHFRAEWFTGAIPDLEPRLKGFVRPDAVLRPDWAQVMARWAAAKTGPLGPLGGAKEQILEMHRSGATAAEIARHFGVSWQAVIARLNNWGETTAGPGRPRKKGIAA